AKLDYWQPTPMSSRYDGIISSTASQFGVDRALVKAMVQVESSYNPNAISKKGAYGLMQLMPDTARRYGVKDRGNPSENLRGGVRYLKDLLEMFDQNTRLAVAAYNAGEHTVIRYNGVPPYRETINYVKKVTTLRQIYTQ
ncbi:MAG: lytic transglycosylase domain-containing protein, partial [Gammaproteobacteria bacterium]